MADLGAIGYSFGTARTQADMPAPPALAVGAAPGMQTAPRASALVLNGRLLDASFTIVRNALSGTVSVLGVGTAGLVVRAFRRDNGALLGETVSGAGGVFTLPLVGFTGEAMVVAYDADGGTEYNAVVFDRVLPV